MDLLLVVLAGFLAAGVDGALGMGFGPTAAAMLLATGMSPHTVATTVNLAKAGAGLAGGLAHWRFDNVDWRLVRRLAVPGACGAALGATMLSSVDGDAIRPLLAGLLLIVALRMLWRTLAMHTGPAGRSEPQGPKGERHRGVVAVATVGGCINGLIGTWGPVVTPYLVQRGVPPRIVIGSVNTAEIAVAVVAFGTLGRSGTHAFELDVGLAMLVGGVVAAPAAAWAIARIPARIAGLCLAGLLLLTQTRELADAAGVGATRWFAYAGILAAVGLSARATRPARRACRAAEPAGIR